MSIVFSKETISLVWLIVKSIVIVSWLIGASQVTIVYQGF